MMAYEEKNILNHYMPTHTIFIPLLDSNNYTYSVLQLDFLIYFTRVHY
jgi:hypothetical protein